MCVPRPGQGPAEIQARHWAIPVLIFSALLALGFFGGNWASGIAGVMGMAAGAMILTAQPGRQGASNYLTAAILMSAVIVMDLIGVIGAVVFLLWLNDLDCSALDAGSGEDGTLPDEGVTRGGGRGGGTLLEDGAPRGGGGCGGIQRGDARGGDGGHGMCANSAVELQTYVT